jgi:hypothetical protein
MNKFKWYKWTDENIKLLRENVKISTSFTCLIKNMNFKQGNGAIRRLKNAIKKYNISTEHFLGQGWSKGKNIITYPTKSGNPMEKHFCVNSKTGRSMIKKCIIQEKFIPYMCGECGLIDNWNNRPINLHLDHINGINNDNRLENLRFLCPNCHSQTDTYCSNVQNRYSDEDIKKASENCTNIRQVMLKMNMTTGTNYNRLKKLLPHLVKKPFVEPIDSIEVSHQKSEYNGSNKSKEWVTKIGLSNRRVKDRPSKEDLSKMIENTPIVQIAKQYNVSDNAIRKWCKAYDLQMKPRGYWEKVKYSKV